MKIKTDFVTNSSSVSFIFESHNMIRRKDITWKFDRWEHLRCFKSKKALITFVQNFKCDWISEIRGPHEFYNMNKTDYKRCLNIINKGNIAIYSVVERHKGTDDFQNSIEGKGAKLLYKERD